MTDLISYFSNRCQIFSLQTSNEDDSYSLVCNTQPVFDGGEGDVYNAHYANLTVENLETYEKKFCKNLYSHFFFLKPKLPYSFTYIYPHPLLKLNIFVIYIFLILETLYYRHQKSLPYIYS